MSDQQVAMVARDLAEALCTFAYERRDDDRKHVAQLQSELCRVVRAEVAEEKAADQQQLQI